MESFTLAHGIPARMFCRSAIVDRLELRPNKSRRSRAPYEMCAPRLNRTVRDQTSPRASIRFQSSSSHRRVQSDTPFACARIFIRAAYTHMSRSFLARVHCTRHTIAIVTPICLLHPLRTYRIINSSYNNTYTNDSQSHIRSCCLSTDRYGRRVHVLCCVLFTWNYLSTRDVRVIREQLTYNNMSQVNSDCEVVG